MSSQNTYIYKIGLTFPKVEAEQALPLSELDRVSRPSLVLTEEQETDDAQADGFIHLSTKEQVPATVGRFFAEHKRVRQSCSRQSQSWLDPCVTNTRID